MIQTNFKILSPIFNRPPRKMTPYPIFRAQNFHSVPKATILIFTSHKFQFITVLLINHHHIKLHPTLNWSLSIKILSYKLHDAYSVAFNNISSHESWDYIRYNNFNEFVLIIEVKMQMWWVIGLALMKSEADCGEIWAE